MARKVRRPARAATADADAENTRIAPDPVAVVLPALSALGVISSIAALAFVAQERTSLRQRNRRRPVVALRDLERDSADLQALFRRISRNYGELLWDRDSGEASAKLASPPMKFGVHHLRIAQPDYPRYQSLVSESASLLSRAAQDSYDVICAVEDGEIDVPETTYFGFGECQERLNVLLSERASLRTSLAIGDAIAGQLKELVNQLKLDKSV